MENNSEMEKLLYQLKSAVLSSQFSRERVISAMFILLSWLNEPENNTDNNCRFVDSYVAYEIAPAREYKALPDDIQRILFDMGATLHDTHSSPEIAENYFSTPSQLLERIRRIKSK